MPLRFLLFSSIAFFSISNFVAKKNIEEQKNISAVTNSSEFSIFTKYLVSKITSPYKEESYQIKKNDSIERILKNFNIKADDIKNVSIELKKNKLTSIYSGRKLSLIYKKEEDGSLSLINLNYPLSNTRSIEVRKKQDKFIMVSGANGFTGRFVCKELKEKGMGASAIAKELGIGRASVYRALEV